MEERNILDIDSIKTEKNKVFKFQIVELLLITTFCLLLLLNQVLSSHTIYSLLIVCAFLIFPFFSMVRIYFEYKNKLITRIGIVLKVYLLIVIYIAFVGILFKVSSYPYASELIILSFMSFSFAYLIYVLLLRDVSIPIKAILSINSFAIGVLILGVLFSVESWSYSQELMVAGFILLLISTPFFGFIPRMNKSQKESYHSLNYFARSIAFLIYSFFIMMEI